MKDNMIRNLEGHIFTLDNSLNSYKQEIDEKMEQFIRPRRPRQSEEEESKDREVKMKMEDESTCPDQTRIE